MATSAKNIPMTPAFSIHTERLVLREFQLDDAPFIIELLNTEGWKQFIGDRSVRTREDAQHYLRLGPLASYARHGFGLWHVALREGESPAGMCGLLRRDGFEDVEIGFAFLPQHAGRGYAAEAATATLAHAAGTLGLKRIIALCQPDNTASLRLLARLGFQFERAVNSAGTELHQFGRHLVID